MAEVQTPKETPKDTENPEEPKGTAGEETPEEPVKEPKTPPEPDYKVKFRESQQEAIRLAKQVEELKKVPKEPEKPKEEPKPGGSDELDRKITEKVQEALAPLTAKQEKEVVDKWLDRNPDAIDYLKQIEDSLPKVPGNTVQQRLENAYLIAKKDVMREAGKKEMAFNLYQREQAIASGGGVSSSGAEEPEIQLSEEEKKVARSMGLTEEAYAKRKAESK